MLHKTSFNPSRGS